MFFVYGCGSITNVEVITSRVKDISFQQVHREVLWIKDVWIDLRKSIWWIDGKKKLYDLFAIWIKRDRYRKKCHVIRWIDISRWTVSHLNPILKRKWPRNPMLSHLRFFFYKITAEQGNGDACCFARDMAIWWSDCHYIFRMISLFNEKLWHTWRRN